MCPRLLSEVTASNFLRIPHEHWREAIVLTLEARTTIVRAGERPRVVCENEGEGENLGGREGGSRSEGKHSAIMTQRPA
jgi:hypothetical protein